MQPADKDKDKSERRIKKKDSCVRHEFECPICGKTFKIVAIRHKSDSKVWANCTTNCSKCGGLILIENRKLYDFHKRMNEKTDGQWPKNGASTGCVEF